MSMSSNAGRTRFRMGGEDGITLVESVISLFICAVVLTAAAGAALASVKGTVVARANQQSANVLTEEIEKVRAFDYAATTMVESDLAGDPAISGTGPYTYNGETLIVDTVGLVNPHRSTVDRNNVTYSISRYVTDASDASGSYKKLTVVAQWSLYGTDKTKTASTILTDTRRGLPLPRFNFALNGNSSPQTVGVGDQLTWGFKLENLGARDVWNITHDGSAAWSYYVDDDADGVLDSTETTLLGDTDGNGVRDTGAIETNAVVYFVATRATTTAEFSPQTTTFTAASASQPPPASEAKTVSATANLTGSTGGGAACPSGVACTLVTRGLDQKSDGAASSTNPMPMSAATILQSSVFDYSTDLSAGLAGRELRRGGVGATEQDLYEVVDFRFQVPSGQTLKAAGTAGLQLYARCLTGGATYTMNAYLGVASNSNMNNFTSYGSGTATVSGCSSDSFAPVTISVPLSQFATSKYLVLRVIVDASSTTNLRLLYDTTSAPAALTLPEV
jgi:type II secretory pathway pseudopilin PulG